MSHRQLEQVPKIQSVSILSTALQITGKVYSEGEIQLDGRVLGEIHCKTLRLSESAELEGSAIAETVVIKGRVSGRIKGQRVQLETKGHVAGDICHHELTIDHGAHFEGESQPSLDPINNRTGIQLALLKAKGA